MTSTDYTQNKDNSHSMQTPNDGNKIPEDDLEHLEKHCQSSTSGRKSYKPLLTQSLCGEPDNAAKSSNLGYVSTGDDVSTNAKSTGHPNQKHSSSESVKENCKPCCSAPSQTESSDSSPGGCRLPSPVDPASHQHSAARDGFDESSSSDSYGIPWVSDNAWPKNKICKRYKICKSKRINNQENKLQRIHQKPYDRKGTEIPGPINGGVNKNESSPLIKETSKLPNSCLKSPNRNRNSFLTTDKPLEDVFQSRTDEYQSSTGNNLVKWSSEVCESSSYTTSESLSRDTEPNELIICDKNELSDETSKSSHSGKNSKTPESARLLKGEFAKRRRMRTKSNKTYEVESDSDSSKLCSEHNVNYKISTRVKTNSHPISKKERGKVEESSTYLSVLNIPKRSLTSSSEASSDTEIFSVSEPNSAMNSSKTIDLGISAAYFSDSSPDFSSSPTLTSPVLMSKKPLSIQGEQTEFSPVGSESEILQQSVDAIKSAYEEALEQREELTHAVENMNNHPTENNSYYQGEDAPSINWAPNELENSLHENTASQGSVLNSEGLNYNYDGEGYNSDSPQNINSQLSPKRSPPNNSPFAPYSDSDCDYSPKSSEMPEYYYHNEDPLGLSLPSPGFPDCDSYSPMVTAPKPQPDTPRPDFYYPRAGVYSYWEGPCEPLSTRQAYSSEVISPAYSNREGILHSPNYVHHHDHHNSPPISPDEERRLEVCDLAETIEYIKHQETVLLDTVDKLQKHRWILEARFCSLIEKQSEEEVGLCRETRSTPM